MHSLRFRLIVGIGATALNLALVLGTNYLLGTQCALGVGATFGIAIFAGVSKLFRRGVARRKERRLATAGIIVGILCGTAIIGHAFQSGMHRTQARMRAANQLAKELETNERYELVIVSYLGPPEQNDERLSVRGYVPNSDDLEPLRRLIYDDREWSVDWEVDVMED